MIGVQTGTLTPPVSAVDHVQGPATAPVTLVEYGDYECPFCGQAYPIVQAIQRRFGHQLRFAFRHFPLTQIHPHAQAAAEAAEVAAAQGAFWPMHDMLYEHQNALTYDHLVRYAEMLNLDIVRFTSELATGAYASLVREHFMSGVRSGVNGTPTFFINGRRHDGPWDLESLGMEIDRAARSRMTQESREQRIPVSTEASGTRQSERAKGARSQRQQGQQESQLRAWRILSIDSRVRSPVPGGEIRTWLPRVGRFANTISWRRK